MLTFKTLPAAKDTPLEAIVGVIPGFIDEANEASATQQIDANYQHGGGWNPLDGWSFDYVTNQISFSSEEGRETYDPKAVAKLRNEKIFVYDSAWVCVLNTETGSFAVARID